MLGAYELRILGPTLGRVGGGVGRIGGGVAVAASCVCIRGRDVRWGVEDLRERDVSVRDVHRRG